MVEYLAAKRALSHAEAVTREATLAHSAFIQRRGSAPVAPTDAAYEAVRQAEIEQSRVKYRVESLSKASPGLEAELQRGDAMSKACNSDAQTIKMLTAQLA